jgi:hypothetical protein
MFWLCILMSCVDSISAFCAVVSGAQELAALDKRISEEKTKNCYLQ